jgi:hypothetical protein
MEIKFELVTFCSDVMLNHHLFQKFKWIENGENLINILTVATTTILLIEK